MTGKKAKRVHLMNKNRVITSLASSSPPPPSASAEPMLAQLLPSNTKRRGNTAFLECQVNVNPFEYAYIHWYRQRPGERLERILYLSSNDNVIHEDGISEERYEAKKRGSDSSASLRIHQVTEADGGLYYCACWDSTGWVKNFGEGTQLIILQSESPFKKKPPKPIFFLPTSEEIKQKQSGTYICLLEDFFPNVVKTYWKEDGNAQPLDAQFGQITGSGNSYSQVSWLTVKEDVLRKNLTYFYQHEDLGTEPKEVSIPSVWGKVFSKESPSGACEDTQRKAKGKLPMSLEELHFANMSAYYTYTLLLVKSITYFIFILFFLYQKTMDRSPKAK
ncbi:TCR gamma alternate reading frame protein [Gracilinanus agilis]|uniref:TCR gamma alternate reading frame protein n=1 Tax=Gracilinanus agilis TaxID=191870 RepID=UPI001CFDD218|nr:TCR gamma alternate reading frame protein [Gracilinanus agilis]